MGFMDIFKPRPAAPPKPAPVAPDTLDRKAFFSHCRATVMGPTLDGDEVSGAETILAAMKGAPVSHCAYALATAWHETAHTMQPIREIGGPSYFLRMYDIRGSRPDKARELGNIHPGDGALYAGRGYVQLTGRTNYENAAKRLGYPLAGHPDLAMRPDIAALIMRQGMQEGWFTGKAFHHYLPAKSPAPRVQFVEARRIINGKDRAAQIAIYAVQFQEALIEADWP